MSTAPKSNRTTTAKRFWSKVKLGYHNQCWPWIAGLTHNGYGKFSIGSRDSQRIIRAHRFAWEFFKGEIPTASQVLHRCDNRLCCNPSHLFLGTNIDNVADKVAKNRQARVINPRGARGLFSTRSEVAR